MTSFFGAEATKARFVEMSGRSPDLHLATHGILDAESPQRSHLLFAGHAEAGRRLEVDEIAGLRLRNGFVALSACSFAHISR